MYCHCTIILRWEIPPTPQLFLLYSTPDPRWSFCTQVNVNIYKILCCETVTSSCIHLPRINSLQHWPMSLPSQPSMDFCSSLVFSRADCRLARPCIRTPVSLKIKFTVTFSLNRTHKTRNFKFQIIFVILRINLLFWQAANRLFKFHLQRSKQTFYLL